MCDRVSTMQRAFCALASRAKNTLKWKRCNARRKHTKPLVREAARLREPFCRPSETLFSQHDQTKRSKAEQSIPSRVGRDSLGSIHRQQAMARAKHHRDQGFFLLFSLSHLFERADDADVPAPWRSVSPTKPHGHHLETAIASFQVKTT